MAIRRILTFALVVLASLLIGINSALGRPGDEEPSPNSVSDDDLKTATIRLERIGCFGTCPAYTLAVHGDGRVEYEGKDRVKEKGAREGQIEIAKVKALLSEFLKDNFVTLPEDYPEAKCRRYCTDMATAITELTLKGVTHHVKHYYGCGGVPKVLFDLEAAVDKAVNVEQWTGDVAKAGPFGTTCWNRN